MAKKKSRSNTKFLLLLLLIPIGFVTYFVLIDEPTQYQVQADDPVTPTIDEEIVIELPPIEEVFDLAVPIPTFEPLQVAITPVITTTNDLGISVTTRGDRTFLQDITGLDITISGQPDITYNMGTINIDMEVDTSLLPSEVFVDFFWGSTLLRNGERLDTSSEFAGGVPTSGGIGGTGGTGGFVIGGATPTVSITIFDNTQLAEVIIDQGDTTLEFILDEFIVNLNPDDPLTFTKFNLTNSVKVYEASFVNNPIEIINQTIPENATEIIIEEPVTEDTPFVPCPLPVKLDSISILFPSIEFSGTTALWDKIIIDGKSHDIINVDIRNNRNCELTLAVGSEWKRVTGQIFKSDIETFLVPTNGTQPFRSIPFDGTVDCGTPAGNCGGLEIQWCFIAKATVDDITEIVDPFCGKKFYR